MRQLAVKHVIAHEWDKRTKKYRHYYNYQENWEMQVGFFIFVQIEVYGPRIIMVITCTCGEKWDTALIAYLQHVDNK